MTRTALAKALGVDEKSLRNWQKRPDAPKEKTVEAWAPYITANHLAKGMTRASYAELREEKIKEEIRLLKLKAAREEGKTIATAEVESFTKDWMATIDLVLTSELEVNAPPLLTGKSIVEIREAMRSVHDRIRDATAHGLLKWKPAD
jgi:hypothetical protein